MTSADTERGAVVTLSGVCERDIDLLLLEEFHSSIAFQTYFLHSLDGAVPTNAEFEDAQHSVSNSLGQSDLVVDFALESQRWRILIENKVDAQFQPGQARRYQQRGSLDQRGGICQNYVTVLVAPEAYIAGLDADDRNDFDRVVPYEQIRTWFESAEELGTRRYCKVALLDAAIEKAVAVIADEVVTDFWKRYAAIGRDIATDLGIPESKGKPTNSYIMYFHPAIFPKGVVLRHVFHTGKVELLFRAKAEQISGLWKAFHPHALPNLIPGKHGKSAVLQLEVPKIVVNAPFAEQEDSARQGLVAAKELHGWFLRNVHLWNEFLKGEEAGVLPQKPISRNQEAQPTVERRKACRESWKTEPMPPTAHKTIPFHRLFTPEEYERLSFGLVPEEMEDKWFIFLEEDRLRFHRSWTGYCIYEAKLTRRPSGFEIACVTVNRDVSQYSNTDDEHDVEVLQNLLDSLVRHRP